MHLVGGALFETKSIAQMVHEWDVARGGSEEGNAGDGGGLTPVYWY